MQQNPTYNLPVTPVVPESPIGETAQATPAPKNKNVYMVVIAVLVVIVLALMSLAVYLVVTNLDEPDSLEEVQVNQITVVPSEESEEETLLPSNTEPTSTSKSSGKEFNLPLEFIYGSHVARGTMDADAIANSVVEGEGDSEVKNISITGDGYKLDISLFYESMMEEYTEFKLIETEGQTKVARVKHDFLVAESDVYKYVRSDDIKETGTCEGMGPDDEVVAPCGSSHYVGGNEVETFYILDIRCDAVEQYLTKCDDIVKSLTVEY
jgi:hypothetical protein